MARLIYSAIMSLDGYIADADGRSCHPSEEGSNAWPHWS